MGVLQNWEEKYYSETTPQQELKKLWEEHFKSEKEFYAEILKTPDEKVTGTVKELAERFNVDTLSMTGILDGINTSLREPLPMEELEEDSAVTLDIDLELLYKNMVGQKADWLYTLPEWDEIFTSERRDELYKEQKRSTTVVKEARIYPNDPCPCGSGKKYKKCHGKGV